MDNPVQATVAACRDLSEFVPGLEVIDRGEQHLKISNPSLAMWFQGLCEDSVSCLPKPPNPFKSEIEVPGQYLPANAPWLSPVREYISDHNLSGSEYIVSFVNFGESGTNVSQTRKRREKYANQRQDDLLKQGIDPEYQIIITIDDRVTEAVAHTLSAYYLTKSGWFVSTDRLYIPPGDRGIPDIVAWKSPFTETLRKSGLVKNGTTIQDLVCIDKSKVGRLQPSISSSVDTARQTLVAEVKGSERSLGEANSQLRKYLRWRSFDEGYCVVPGYRDRDLPNSGVVTFDDAGFQSVSDPVRTDGDRVRSDEDKKMEFCDHMDAVAQQALLCNLDFSDILDVSSSDIHDSSPNQFIQDVWNIDSKTIIGAVLNNL